MYTFYHAYLFLSIENSKENNMKKKLIIALVILGLIIILLLNFLSVLAFLNVPLNRLVIGTPDRGCNEDADCDFRIISCGPCDCGAPVNKEWTKEPFCPFRNPLILCKMCPSPNYDFEIKCVENQCQKVWLR